MAKNNPQQNALNNMSGLNLNLGNIQSVANNVKGSPGYVPPNYGLTGQGLNQGSKTLSDGFQLPQNQNFSYIPTSVSNSNAPGSMSGVLPVQGNNAINPVGAQSTVPGSNIPQQQASSNQSQSTSTIGASTGTTGALPGQTATTDPLAPATLATSLVSNANWTPQEQSLLQQNAQTQAAFANRPGLLNYTDAQANAAGQAFSNQITPLLSQQQIQQNALGTALNASLPQQAGYGSNVYSPLTGQQYGNAGQGQGTGPGAGGFATGTFSAAQQIPQMKVNLSAANVDATSLQNLISQNHINPADPQVLNGFNQFLQTGIASNPAYQEFYGTLADYTGKMSSVTGGGSTTNAALTLAGNLLNQYASGKSTSDVLDYNNTLGQQNIDAMTQSVLGGNSGGASNTSGSVQSAGGGSYQQVNGQWQYVR